MQEQPEKDRRGPKPAETMRKTEEDWGKHFINLENIKLVFPVAHPIVDP